ncbi:MAG: polyamine aminopropyltransferase [Paludibacterium sp.]|uniref:polyamine aminopropyltransferase n=1 Tax=Paludibacterium sp. TaxID=1917523 RepID=UPI0025FAE908|nr:polyamine aminopropyltransferase [Paludibacterium sp.]MBV8048876.1 polyamine aminopropyltransferase [Paludibacterium sp.]MBV8648039.1 polyamine aminopropyltransferase [Paludibacterium sp.]
MASKARHPFRRRVRPGVDAMPEVEISEADGIRSLHLGSETIQSSMNLEDPTDLVLSYSRAMMGFLLFNDAPAHILQIGLGGGSLARYIDFYLRDAQSVAVDINPQVINVARAFFALPEEGERFEVVEADGAEYVRIFRDSTDVILVDGFDGLQIVDALTTEDFFVDCRRALTADGIFVTNWWSGDKRYMTFLERLLGVFEGRVLELPSASHGNVAVMAFNSQPKLTRWAALEKRVDALEARFGLEFGEFVERMRQMNPLSERCLNP